MHDLATKLFPICRSLSGNGVRETLSIIQKHLPDLRLHEVPSGTKCFDWTVPPEWNISGAYIIDPDGKRICDFAESNLHVVGYSVPVDVELPLSELQDHLYSLPEQPDAIPYVTSYYQERWGFCLCDSQRKALKEGTYRAVIDSTLMPGTLTYGELLIPGKLNEEIFISTYVCHPSMANNELSGPVVSTYLAKWLLGLKNRRYSYRFVFVPETIGSITYISKNLDLLKEKVKAGFNVTCVGDDRSHSYLPSRLGDTISDEVALHVLSHVAGDFSTYSYLERGSDERQYCSAGVDLPVVSVMRSKYATYPEYHTSLDDLTLVTPSGLAGGYEALQRCLEVLECNMVYKGTILCEPQMGKRGLYSTLGTMGREGAVAMRMNVLAYADGTASVLDIARKLDVPAWELKPYFDELLLHDLLEIVR